MKHDETNFDSNPHPAPSLDPELEARVVAWVLGEASPFEAAELERRSAVEPALAEFKRSIEAVHGLVGVAERPVTANGSGVVWRMEPTRRAELLAKLGGGGADAAAEGAASDGANVVSLPMPSRRTSPWRAWVMPMAACLTLAGLLAAIVVPTGGTFGIASKKPKRPDPSTVVMSESHVFEPSGVDGFSTGYAAPAENEARVQFNLPLAVEALSGAKNKRAVTATEERQAYAFEQPVASAPASVAAPMPAAKSVQFAGTRANASRVSDEYLKESKDSDLRADQRMGGFGGGVGADGLEALSGEVRLRRAERDQAGYADKSDLSATVDTVSGSASGSGVTWGDAGSPREISKLRAEGRSRYLAGDIDGAQETFRLVETHNAEDAEAKYFIKRISDEKAKLGALDREKVRALMVEEVAKSWQRPGVFKENKKAEADKAAPEAADQPMAKASVVVPPFDESLRAEVATESVAVSTFSLHVGDASFRLAKAALDRGAAPDAATIRPEEFYNAFDYGDPAPATGEPVAGRVEQAAHPFLQQRNLVRIALRVPAAGRGAGTPLSLTVLLDTSGSMEREDRAATVRAALGSLAALLGANDRVTLVGFARQPRLLVEGLAGDQAGQLAELAANTPAEGGTNLEEALKLAGELARRQWRAGAQNRIVLLTDGAANLGDADPARLSAQVEALRRQGVAFDACGVGADGLDDGVLEALTRKGDGRYQVLNSPEEADAGFARKLAGAFRPAAENVKVQVRFNPARVARYRLIGFEKHRLREEDFRNDRVDAAELAAEEAAVALYQVEVIPGAELGELGDVAVRFRDPARGEMVERNWSLAYEAQPAAFDRASASLRLAGASALLAEKLRGGALAGQIRLDELAPVVAGLRGAYVGDGRVEDFVRMFDQARRLIGE